jgi:hypothetical protein
MKTIEELKSRIQELSKQALELRKQGTEAYQSNCNQAKEFRLQARETMNRCQVLIQEMKRHQG